MIIGLLSDTHNNESNLVRALSIFREQGIKRLFHCGDLTEPGMVKYFGGFDVVYVFGNVDSCREEIAVAWKNIEKGNWTGVSYSGDLEGVKIAATHGHIEGEVNSLAMSGNYKYVFHGHTHRKRDELVGDTRVINPGAVGKALDGYSICMLDISIGKASFISIV